MGQSRFKRPDGTWVTDDERVPPEGGGNSGEAEAAEAEAEAAEAEGGGGGDPEPIRFKLPVQLMKDMERTPAEKYWRNLLVENEVQYTEMVDRDTGMYWLAVVTSDLDLVFALQAHFIDAYGTFAMIMPQ